MHSTQTQHSAGHPSMNKPIITLCALGLTMSLSFAQAEEPAGLVTDALIAPSSQARLDLAALLDGVEDQCRYNSTLERFWRALADPEQALRLLDPQIQTVSGPIRADDEIDYLMYSIPMRGSWRQIPVSQIQFGLGKGNGIHVLLVEFDAPAHQAKAVFEPLIEQSRAAMEKDPDNVLNATTDLIVEADRVRLICDLST